MQISYIQGARDFDSSKFEIGRGRRRGEERRSMGDGESEKTRRRRGESEKMESSVKEMEILRLRAGLWGLVLQDGRVNLER
ncbi:hypothetical protein Droror1_Dr00010687 [Drosera rotundifolia]